MTALRNLPLRRFDAADRVALRAVAGDASRGVDLGAVGDVRLGVLAVVQGGLRPGRRHARQCRHESEARNLKESTHQYAAFPGAASDGAAATILTVRARRPVKDSNVGNRAPPC